MRCNPRRRSQDREQKQQKHGDRFMFFLLIFSPGRYHDNDKRASGPDVESKNRALVSSNLIHDRSSSSSSSFCFLFFFLEKSSKKKPLKWKKESYFLFTSTLNGILFFSIRNSIPDLGLPLPHVSCVVL